MNKTVRATPSTKECTNAANLTIMGCSNLVPNSASSNIQEPTTRKKRGAGGRGAGAGAGAGGPTGTEGLGAAPESVNAENLFLYYYMNMDAQDRMMIGHQFDDTIKACSFRGKDCLSSE